MDKEGVDFEIYTYIYKFITNKYPHIMKLDEQANFSCISIMHIDISLVDLPTFR